MDAKCSEMIETQLESISHLVSPKLVPSCLVVVVNEKLTTRTNHPREPRKDLAVPRAFNRRLNSSRMPANGLKSRLRRMPNAIMKL